MKIIHLLDTPWWSGLAAYAFDCVKAHRDLGHETILACERGSLPYKKAAKKHWPVLGICGRGNLGGFINFFHIGAILYKEKPDWAISHTGSTHWILWLWSKIFKVKIARTRATSQKLKGSAINRMIYAGTDAIIAASGHLGKECSRFRGEPAANVSVLYPPVDLPAQESASQRSFNGNRTLGILARLDPVKGHREFLKAFKEVQVEFPDAALRLAGAEENVSWNSLLREVDALKIQNVIYHGFLPHEKIGEFRNACAAGVVPSLGSEEVSRALLEWMAEGKPVVATNAGCIPEILKDEGGYIVDRTEVYRMADKLKDLLRDPEKAQRMGELNRKICQDSYSPERFAKNWERILNHG